MTRHDRPTPKVDPECEAAQEGHVEIGDVVTAVNDWSAKDKTTQEIIENIEEVDVAACVDIACACLFGWRRGRVRVVN